MADGSIANKLYWYYGQLVGLPTVSNWSSDEFHRIDYLVKQYSSRLIQ